MAEKTAKQPASETAAPAADDAKPKSKKKLIIVVAIVLLLSASITGAWLMMKEPEATAEDGAHAQLEPRKTPVFVDLDSFTVNLSRANEDEEDRYLQIKLVAEVRDVPASDVLKSLMPAVRNEIIFLLGTKRADEILSRTGKETLAKDIAAAANRPLTRTDAENGVESINITHMIVQ